MIQRPMTKYIPCPHPTHQSLPLCLVCIDPHCPKRSLICPACQSQSHNKHSTESITIFLEKLNNTVYDLPCEQKIKNLLKAQKNAHSRFLGSVQSLKLELTDVFFELTGKATSNFNNNQTNVEQQLKALRRASQTLNYDENNSTLLADFEGVLKEYVCSRVAEGRLVQEVEDMVQQAGEKMERQLEKIRVVCGEMRRKLSEVAGGCEGVDLGFSVVKSMDDMRSSGGIVVQEVAKPMAKGEMCVEDCAIDETQCTIINSNMAKSKKEVCKQPKKQPQVTKKPKRPTPKECPPSSSQMQIQPLHPVHFSPDLHHPSCKLSSNFLTVQRTLGAQSRFLVGCITSLPLPSTHSKCTFKFLIDQSSTSCVGICSESSIKKNMFESHRNWRSVGHNHYLIAANKKVFSHKESELNGEEKGFWIRPKDEIMVEFTGNIVRFEKKKSVDKLVMEVAALAKGDVYRFCVYLSHKADKVEIIE